MASFNKVILMGNLTRDPELRVTPEGLSICKMGLACNRVFYTKDGTKKEEVLFVDCDAFGKQAENIAKYMSKGRAILIEGRLKLDNWETPSGEKRSKMTVVVENSQFVGGRGEGGASAGAEAAPAEAPGGYEEHTPPPRESRPNMPAKTTPAAPAPPAPKSNNGGDDVPF